MKKKDICFNCKYRSDKINKYDTLKLGFIYCDYWEKPCDIIDTCENYRSCDEDDTPGNWIYTYPLTYKCSSCNGEALDFNEYPYRSNFCPHCGKKMKGNEE